MPRYYISIADLDAVPHGPLAFRARGAEGIAAELQQALRADTLFTQWSRLQDDPEDVDPALAATDPAATVTGEQNDLRIDLEVDTSLPSPVLRHRLGLLAGERWRLHDVR